MSPQRTNLIENMVIAAVQTLAFGIILALLTYNLNTRLERDKTMLASLQPEVTQRRLAYADLRQTARETRDTLVAYYPGHDPDRWDRLAALEETCGIRPSPEASRGRISTKDAVRSLKKFMLARQKYDDIASRQVKAAADELIDNELQDIGYAAKHSEDTTFGAGARSRLRAKVTRLSEAIRGAMGVDKIP